LLIAAEYIEFLLNQKEQLKMQVNQLRAHLDESHIEMDESGDELFSVCEQKGS